jgi:hypothetical protein
MEGMGKSQTKEFRAIKECYRSLKENKYLTLKNLAGITIRSILFFFRRGIILLGGEPIMKILKRKKYTPVT